jgi:hypothetical protein
VRPRLERLALPPAATAKIDEQLPKMAGAELKSVPLDPQERAAAQQAIDEAFVSGFRLAVLGSAILALAGAGFGAAIRDRRPATHS